MSLADEGTSCPFWSSLRSSHLQGLQEGHCGFYSARHDLLFSGDLFANSHQPRIRRHPEQ